MGDTNNEDTNSNVNSNVDTGNNDNSGSENNSENNQEVDVGAFAELISEKDKRIEQLEQDMKMLKKSNADLLLKISTNNRTEMSFDEKLLNLVGDKPRKE